MKISDLLESKDLTFDQILKQTLPMIMRHLELDSLPKMVFQKKIKDHEQPTFGRYVNDEDTLYISLDNRHPMDVIRTLAHELVHYKQDLENQLGHHSGRTGSPQENQANALAGIIMRHINKKYPEFLKSDNIET